MEPRRRQGGSKRSRGYHGWSRGWEKSLTSDRARGALGGSDRPRVLRCMGCQRGRRLETWHGISLQSEGWGHVPAGKHISGTEIPQLVPGSSPFTAHQLPRLLPKVGRESGSPFPTWWPQSCRRGSGNEPPAPHQPGPALIILAATWDPRTSYLSCSSDSSSSTRNQINTAICSNLL